MRPKVALQRRTGLDTNITKGNQTNSQTDKTTNRLGAEGLSKQMGLEGPFEVVKRGDVADLRRESVPEGGGCHTEGSVPEGLQVVSRPESEDRRGGHVGEGCPISTGGHGHGGTCR